MEIVSPIRDLRFDVEQSLPARFAHVAAQFPDSPAVSGVETPLTYSQLAAAAGALADAILANGGVVIAGETAPRIAVLARHDALLEIAVLGILLAGRAVTVLHSSDPPARLRQILEEAGPQILVADRHHRAIAAEIAGPASTLLIEDTLEKRTPAPPSPLWVLASSIPPTALAWLIFTSGSSGRPKAVMQTHRNILHNVCRLSHGMSITANDRVALCSSLSTAQGLSTLWCALCNGAASCLFPVSQRGVTGMSAWLDSHRISVLVTAGSVFRQLVKTLPHDGRLAHVRLLRLSAESATPADFAAFQRHFPPNTVLFHALSSSEAGNITQHVMQHSDTPSAGTALPVGRPSPQLTLLLHDDSGRPVSPGEIGEIIVRSSYLSPGYWNNPTLTAQRFAVAEGPDQSRLYRTGDRARQNAAGLLEYVGRKDSQLKIHGHRVELGEVEAVLCELPRVQRAVVLPVQEPGTESLQLVAFLVCEAGQNATADQLRAALPQRLPSYMIPARIVLIATLPLTASGKTDRQALLAVLADASRQPAAPLAPEALPRTPTEERLAALWTEALRRGPVGRESDFFHLGGDSLGASMVAAAVYGTLGVTLDLRAFADHPRLSDLAALIDALRAANDPAPQSPIPRRPPLQDAQLSFTQERIWNHSQTPADSTAYTVTASHLIRGPLDVAALRHAMQFLQARHDMLRTTFHAAPGGPIQRRHAAGDAPCNLPLHDFSHNPIPEKAADAFFREQAAVPFDLAELPLLRFFLLRLGPNEHWLLRINHHILCDGPSWKIYFRELAALYDARVSGKPAPLAMEPEGISFADYAAWQREEFNPETQAFAAAIDWWKHRYTPKPPELRLPFRRPRSFFARKANVTAQDGIQTWGISDTITRALDAIAARNGATYFMTRFAAFLSFLTRETGEEDLVVGTYAGNRSRLETQNIFGDFSNLVSLRVALKRGAPFTEHLATVRQAILDLQSAPRAEIPFDPLRSLVQKRGGNIPAPAAIFLISDHTAPLHFAGLDMSWRQRISDAFQWGFTLAFTQHAEAASNRAWFDPRLHDPEKVRAFVGDFVLFLGALS